MTTNGRKLSDDIKKEESFKSTNNKNIDKDENIIFQKSTTNVDLNWQTYIKELSSKHNKKKVSEHQSISYFQLFRYSTWPEWFLTIGGIFCASISAIGVPLNIVIYGEYTTLLIDRSIFNNNVNYSNGINSTSTSTVILPWFGGGDILTNGTPQEYSDALITDAKAFGIGCSIITLFQMIFAILGLDLVNYSALKQVSRIRKLFLYGILRQDMAWFDKNSTNNFASKITDNLEKLREGIADKLPIFIYLLMSFIFSVIFAFFYGWKLTLVMLSCAPIIIFFTALVSKVQSSLTEKELISYSKAGNIAEEVLSSIRTVCAFSGEQKELDRFGKNLLPAIRNGQKKGVYSGIGGGMMWFIIYCCYALAFWYGIELILNDRYEVHKAYTPAVLVIILFGILAGAQNLGMTSPHIEAFATARGAAQSVYSIIDRVSDIDIWREDGLRPKNIPGNIDFKNVHFTYPSRDVPVLNGLNISIRAGETVALVGPSGCGKSTCIQLIQRLYDPTVGSVEIEGMPLQTINTAWLRSFIGVVGQEPVLFSTTILENIKFGNPNVDNDEIIAAAKIANCHDFIINLKDGYNTIVGERGGLLSGGQKQRIAIARALVRNPRILLLDEATSALDPNSEKHVQDALEKASKGRTTIIVSHHLSTVTNADKIFYIDGGVLVEQGTHKELMDKKGYYFLLVNASSKPSNTTNETCNITKEEESLSLISTEESSRLSLKHEPDVIENIAHETNPVSMKKLFKMNAPEWHFILIGCVSAIVVGSTLPAFAIIFGEFYGILSNLNDTVVRNESFKLAMLFLGLGLVTGFGTFFQTYTFNVAGVRLTNRLRKLLFKSFLQQEMGWFDDSNNSVGVLCARLSGDCASVQGATGTRIGSILQSVSILIFGAIISFFYSWKLSIVAIISVPIVLLACFLEIRYVANSNLAEKTLMENACKIAVESISNMRTVASLGLERHILNRYITEISNVERISRKKIRLRGTIYAIGQAVPFFIYALTLFYGGILVATEGLPYQNVIIVSEALIFGPMVLGAALAYAPNINIAMLSAGRIFSILERIPKYKNSTVLPTKTVSNEEDSIVFSNVKFQYPTRTGFPILNGLDMKITKSQNIALVGPSGGGKSTCVQLLLRYYDPADGDIKVDGIPTVDYPPNVLRSQLGLVSQEPILFDRTIAENIAYGDNSRDVLIEEIIEAANSSNIHEFITSLPMGYDTPLGSKGAQLSGGQKQRIAIARALIRNPKILLLDEATSALDAVSENVVQSTLEKAKAGRTSITIAHRLSTVVNADQIYVIEYGKIAEHGTHSELLRNNGLYSKLYKMQHIEEK